MKACSKCGTNKPFSEFGKQKDCKNGLAPSCKCCKSVVYKKWVKAFPKKRRESKQKWVKAFPKKCCEYARKCREANPKKSREINRKNARKWRQANPGFKNADIANRRAAKLKRTMGWGNRHAITHIYKEASRLSVATNIPYAVDHIIPLQGEFVSGLHIENNLQIITASENGIKSNTFLIT